MVNMIQDLSLKNILTNIREFGCLYDHSPVTRFLMEGILSGRDSKPLSAQRRLPLVFTLYYRWYIYDCPRETGQETRARAQEHY